MKPAVDFKSVCRRTLSLEADFNSIIELLGLKRSFSPTTLIWSWENGGPDSPGQELLRKYVTIYIRVRMLA